MLQSEISSENFSKIFICHKNIVTLWQNIRLMAYNRSFKAIETVVKRADSGEILFPDDFTVCGTPDAVRSKLRRLCRKGKLNSFAKGIYYVPMYYKWDETLREPSLDMISQRIAERQCSYKSGRTSNKITKQYC